MNFIRNAAWLSLATLAACSRAQPPSSAPAPAVPPAVASSFIPGKPQLDRLAEQGPEPTLRRIAVADYWLHYKLMQATGIEQALGGESAAVSALQALGDAYEERTRGAATEMPKMIPATFTGEGMSSGLMGMGIGTFAGLVTAGMTSSMASSLSDKQLAELNKAGPMKNSSDTGSMEMQVGSDGSIAQSIEFEVNKNGVNGKVKMTSRMEACPDENGKVTIEVEVNSQMSVSAKPGTGGYVHTQMKYERYLDDDAHLIEGDEGGASNLHVRLGGYENFEHQVAEVTVGHERGGKPVFEFHEQQGFSLFRPDEVGRLQELLQATELLQTLMAEASLRGLGGPGAPWESGHCVDLKVTSSPAKRTGLRPNTAFDLEAIPRVKGGGEPAGGTVTATLNGGASLQPASGKVRADARYGYAGPDKKNETSSIEFESRSRRGVGKATLNFDTKAAGPFRVSGKSDGATFSGEICSLDQPFVVTVDAITGNWPMEFTPGDSQSGQMKGTYSGSGCTLTGGGPYSVAVDDSGAGTIQFTYKSTATCPAGSRTTSRTEQLHLEPMTGLRCGN
jgi:hypothetical protein